MGTVYTAECEKCGYHKEIFAGAGRMDCMPEAFLKALPDEEGEVFNSALSEGGRNFSIDRKPCVCTECGEIYAMPVVTYQLNGGEHTLTGKCPKCSSKSVEYIENNVPCPKCGTEIILKKTGLWD